MNNKPTELVALLVALFNLLWESHIALVYHMTFIIRIDRASVHTSYAVVKSLLDF